MKNKLNIFERIKRYFYNIRIVDSRPDEFMDIEETPELTGWICDTCHKARVGAYPNN